MRVGSEWKANSMEKFLLRPKKRATDSFVEILSTREGVAVVRMGRIEEQV
jgi:hypothetical protein